MPTSTINRILKHTNNPRPGLIAHTVVLVNNRRYLVSTTTKLPQFGLKSETAIFPCNWRGKPYRDDGANYGTPDIYIGWADEPAHEMVVNDLLLNGPWWGDQ